jgi:hypothetical protein
MQAPGKTLPDKLLACEADPIKGFTYCVKSFLLFWAKAETNKKEKTKEVVIFIIKR